MSPFAIQLPDQICAPKDWRLRNLIDYVYPEVSRVVAQILAGEADTETLNYFCDRALLAPRNDEVDFINNMIQER